MATLVLIILAVLHFFCTRTYKRELRRSEERQRKDIISLYSAFVLWLTIGLIVVGIVTFLAWFNVGYGRIIDKNIKICEEEIEVNRQYDQKYALDVEEATDLKYLDVRNVNLKHEISHFKKKKLHNATWRWLAYFGGWKTIEDVKTD